MSCATELVHQEEDVADVNADTPLQVGFEHHVAGHALPVAVEGETYQAAVSIKDGASGITSSDVVVGEEVDRQVAISHCVLSVVLGLIESLEFGRYLELVVVGIFLLHHTLEG